VVSDTSFDAGGVLTACSRCGTETENYRQNCARCSLRDDLSTGKKLGGTKTLLYRLDGKVWECVRAKDHKFWRLESALWAEAGVRRSLLKESPEKPE
jgi:hypothetical protein